MNTRRFLLLFLGALTVLRIIYAAQTELAPDEAYYFQWSEHLAPSYFSKGPGIALSMWLSTHLFGVSEFGIRVFSPLLGLGTSLLLAGLARRLYSESVAVWTVLLVNCTPIFNAGSLLMTIDPLSIFFWTAALYTFWLALEKSPAFSLWWPATGALIGCGFLAKYTNAMQLLSIVLLLALTPRYRRELRSPGFATLLAVFAIFTTPVIMWNAQHDWITVRHLSERGGLKESPPHRVAPSKDTAADAADEDDAPDDEQKPSFAQKWFGWFHPGEFFEFLGLHFGVYSPFIFLGMLCALPWSWRKARVHFKPRFLLAFTLPLFVLYFTLSLKQTGEPNWTAPATVSLAVLAVAFWHELSEERTWAPKAPVFALAFGAVLSVIAIDAELVRRIGIPLPYKDPSARLRGWRTAAEVVDQARKDFEAKLGKPVFLIADNYGTASALAFYLPEKRREGPGHPPIYCPMSAMPGNQFYFWPRYDALVNYTDLAREILPTLDATKRAALTNALAALSKTGTPDEETENRRQFLTAFKAAAPQYEVDESFTEAMGYNPFIGRTALYITTRDEGRPASVLLREFARWERIEDISIARRGMPLGKIRIFACYDYRQPEL
jgi:hypothetical protein